MQIGNGPWFPSILGNPPLHTVESGSSIRNSAPRSVMQGSRSQLYLMRRLVSGLLRELNSINRPFRSTRVTGTSLPATATSAADLGLSDATAAALESTEEVNATPTSFSPFGPDWSGASTALATIDGVYDGSLGTGTLTFQVARAGVHGQRDLRIRVLAPGGSTLEQIHIDSNDPIDTEYTLSIGLVLTLGEGDLSRNDTLTVDIYDSVGSSVDPDKSFDGTRNDNPNFEYGFSIVPGSFTVNGALIDVLANDTLHSVLDKITQSAAGVTAAFDAGTETVTLTHDTPGSSGAIVLADDTSGFLAATKLSGATTFPGEDADVDKPLEDVTRFASVQSGSISINGEAIAIDVAADSLNDVLARINGSTAGVTASLDGTGQRITIVSNDLERVLVLADGGTGFFPALDMAPGTYDPIEGAGSRGGGMSSHHAHRITDVVKELSEVFNEMFRPLLANQQPTSYLIQLRSNIRDAVSEAFDSGGRRHRTRFGVNFDWEAPGGRVFRFNASDQARLVSTLKRNPRSVNTLFFGSQSSGSDGLVERLITVFEEAESDLNAQLGTTGIYVDQQA